jgi:hypothetical protein
MKKKLVLVGAFIAISLFSANLFAGGGESVFQSLFNSAKALLNLDDVNCFVWIDGAASCESAAVPALGPAKPVATGVDGTTNYDPKDPQPIANDSPDYVFGTQVIVDE